MEDTKDVLDSLVAVVQSWGYKTLAAGDGAGAIHLAMAEHPEIVLADLNMPNISGFEIARFVRRQEWGTSALLIAISAWGNEATRQSAHEAGFDHFFLKPAELKKLRGLLDQSTLDLG